MFIFFRPKCSVVLLVNIQVFEDLVMSKFATRLKRYQHAGTIIRHDEFPKIDRNLQENFNKMVCLDYIL